MDLEPRAAARLPLMPNYGQVVDSALDNIEPDDTGKEHAAAELPGLTWLRLVRTSRHVADGVECLVEVVGDGVGGGDGAGPGLDLDGAIAAGSTDELPA